MLSLKDKESIDFFVSAASITDIFYVLNKRLKDSYLLKKYINDLLEIICVAGVDESCIRNALNSSWLDFEDSVQHETSLQIKADYIVTRNITDFALSFVPVILPGDFLQLF